MKRCKQCLGIRTRNSTMETTQKTAQQPVKGLSANRKTRRDGVGGVRGRGVTKLTYFFPKTVPNLCVSNLCVSNLCVSNLCVSCLICKMEIVRCMTCREDASARRCGAVRRGLRTLQETAWNGGMNSQEGRPLISSDPMVYHRTTFIFPPSYQGYPISNQEWFMEDQMPFWNTDRIFVIYKFLCGTRSKKISGIDRVPWGGSCFALRAIYI